jgi:hypothetical protein
MGCDSSREGMGTDESAIITYDGGGTFSNDVTREIDPSNNTLKAIELGRIQPGSAVNLQLTRVSGPAITFSLQFSPDAINWPGDAPGCSQVPLTNDVANCPDVSGDPGDQRQWARVVIQAPLTGTTTVRIQDTHVGPSDNTNHSHYGSDTITIDSFNPNGTPKLAQRPNGREPGVFQFEQVDITVTKSNSNIDLINGIKLKSLDDNNEIADFKCGGWTQVGTTSRFTMACSLSVAPRDGEIHVPLHMTNTNNNPARWARVAITRTNFVTGAMYVNTELASTSTSP